MSTPEENTVHTIDLGYDAQRGRTKSAIFYVTLKEPMSLELADRIGDLIVNVMEREGLKLGDDYGIGSQRDTSEDDTP